VKAGRMIREDENFKNKNCIPCPCDNDCFTARDESARLRWRRLKVDALHDAIMY